MKLIAGGRAALVHIMCRLSKRERGQTLLEFAFVIPIILVFLLLIADFGIALDRREVLQHAVREGARYGSIGADADAIKQRTSAQSQGLLDNPAMVTVCYADDPGDAETTVGNPGDDVRVTATFTYNFSLGSDEMLGFFSVNPVSIEMTPSADMRLENTAIVPPGAIC